MEVRAVRENFMPARVLFVEVSTPPSARGCDPGFLATRPDLRLWRRRQARAAWPIQGWTAALRTAVSHATHDAKLVEHDFTGRPSKPGVARRPGFGASRAARLRRGDGSQGDCSPASNSGRAASAWCGTAFACRAAPLDACNLAACRSQSAASSSCERARCSRPVATLQAPKLSMTSGIPSRASAAWRRCVLAMNIASSGSRTRQRSAVQNGVPAAGSSSIFVSIAVIGILRERERPAMAGVH